MTIHVICFLSVSCRSPGGGSEWLPVPTGVDTVVLVTMGEVEAVEVLEKES